MLNWKLKLYYVAFSDLASFICSAQQIPINQEVVGGSIIRQTGEQTRALFSDINNHGCKFLSLVKIAKRIVKQSIETC